MHKKNNSVRRRHVVGALAGGAALVWHKPIVQTVILPAHAQTSTLPPSASGGSGSSSTSSSSSSTGSSGGSTGSSGSSTGSSSSSSGGSSGGASAKLSVAVTEAKTGVLTGVACVSDCPDATEMMVMIDLFDQDGVLFASYEITETVDSAGCISVSVNPFVFGISGPFPAGFMFVFAVNVPACNVADQASGFFV